MTDKELDELTERVHHALDVPEPSPLFWDHFPNRVRAAIDAAPRAEAAPWWKRRAFALAMAVMIAGAASFWAWSRLAPSDAPADAPVAVTDGAPAGSVDAVDINDEDAGWQVVGAVAATAGVDALSEAGFGVAPGGAESAIDELSDLQRAELMAMLQAEMNGASSGS